MAFIEKSDYGVVINENILDAITEFDDDKLEVANKYAISYMKGFLSSRFDVDQIFSATGDDRHPVILMYAIDIAAFTLHATINPNKVPKNRRDRHEIAKDWLTDVSRSIINPQDLPVPDGGEKDYIRYGSNPKRSNHI